jgi:hypothetical protein
MSRSIPIHDHANLSASERLALEATIRTLPTLGAVLSWARESTPAWSVADIVTQDEYTHDVVLESPGQPYLAFDTT